MTTPIAKTQASEKEKRKTHTRAEPGRARQASSCSAAARMRRMRQRRARGVVHMACVEVVESDVPLLVNAGYLQPELAQAPAALTEAIERLLENWVDQQLQQRSDP